MIGTGRQLAVATKTPGSSYWRKYVVCSSGSWWRVSPSQSSVQTAQPRLSHRPTVPPLVSATAVVAEVAALASECRVGGPRQSADRWFVSSVGCAFIRLFGQHTVPFRQTVSQTDPDSRQSVRQTQITVSQTDPGSKQSVRQTQVASSQ